MTRHTKGRAAATATAALTAIALAAPSASAADLGPAQFSGAAKGQALQVSLTAPSELLGLLNKSQDTLVDLGVSLTEVRTSTANDLFASTDLLTGLLPVGASSDADGDTYSSGIIPAQELGPIALGVGNHSYAIDRATRAVTSSSELAHVTISIDSLLNGKADVATGAVDQVSDVIDTVLAEADGLAGGIVTEINGIVDDIETTLEDSAGLVLDVPDVQLKDVNVVRNVMATEVLSIRKLWSNTNVAPVGDKVRSTAESGIAGLSILDGLVEIPEWTFSAWAETAGAPGTANWGGNTEKLALNLAGTEILSLDGSVLNVQGIELDLNDPSLAGIIPDPTGLVAELDGLIGDLVDLAGLSIEQGRLVGEAAEDGSSATATASAFTISLAPLHAATAIPELDGLIGDLGLKSADELFRLQVDLLPVTASVSAAPAAPSAPAPRLPRTGGGAAAMVFGLLGMGGALGLRRKF